MNQLDRINYYNILAMLLAGCLAIVIPFELTLLSYAILGPAHYLTEISWLRGRQFFTIKKYDYLLILSVLMIALLVKLDYANLLYYTFGLSLLFLIERRNTERILAAMLLILAGYFLLSNNLLRTIFGLYMATLIHVYVFTGMFLLHGALKNKNLSGYLALASFVACPLVICCLFTSWHPVPTAWAANNYATFAQINIATLRSHSIRIFTDRTSIMLTRFIAFAYTYHYLNWFAKTRIINWHRITATRVILIVLIWSASVALYFYNYITGLKWLFLLSLVHVILEFPLNHRTFIDVAKQLKYRLSSMSLK